MSNSKHKKSALLVITSCAAISFVTPHSCASAETSKKVPASATKRQYLFSSEAELAKVVAQLEVPATRLSAISTLTRFASLQLYQVGSIYWSSGDRNIDALQKQATEAIRKHADFETVSQALDSTDVTLQYWGVWFWRSGTFKSREMKPNPWLSLIPKVKRLAVSDDVDVRFDAVEGLLGFSAAKTFLEERVNAETSPDILVRLLYNTNRVGLSERFNPILLRLLNHQDKDVRMQALGFIFLNHYNHPPAEYQIEFDKSIEDKVLEMTKSELEEERRVAQYALEGMKAELHHD